MTTKRIARAANPGQFSVQDMGDLGLGRLGRMVHAVKEDESLDPTGVRLLDAAAVVAGAKGLPWLL